MLVFGFYNMDLESMKQYPDNYYELIEKEYGYKVPIISNNTGTINANYTARIYGLPMQKKE